MNIELIEKYQKNIQSLQKEKKLFPDFIKYQINTVLLTMINELVSTNETELDYKDKIIKEQQMEIEALQKNNKK